MSYLVLFCSCVVVFFLFFFFFVFFGFVLFFSVLLALRLPRSGKRELILVLFVRLFTCVCFVFSVSSSSWCLGVAPVYDCGAPWAFLLVLFFSILNVVRAHLRCVKISFTKCYNSIYDYN